MIKLNLKQVFLFEVLYRLVVGAVLLNLFKGVMHFTLKQAGYSYLTAANIGAYMLKPWTIPILAVFLLLGLLALFQETGCLITAYQGAAYHRKVSVFAMFAGGLGKAWDEIQKRNWKLLLVILVNQVLLQLVIMYRIFTHVKPMNFVIMEMMNVPACRLGIVLAVLVCAVVSYRTMFVLYASMVEQKSFRDSCYRSAELQKKYGWKSAAMLMADHVATLLLMVLLYAAAVSIVSVCVVLFARKKLAFALLLAICDRMELVVLLIASMLVVLVNYGALTVMYYQYGYQLDQETDWNFASVSYPLVTVRNMRLIIGITTLASLVLLYHITYNSSFLQDSVLGVTQITAHRGSSYEAPENTVAAIEKAVEELADYAEIDVQLTKDGQVVVIHDTSLKRVAGVDRKVADMTLEEIQSMDVGSLVAEEYAGEHVPTLEEVLEYSKGKINLNIELKSIGKNSTLPEQVVELLHEHDFLEQCVITSVSLHYLEEVKALDPDVRTGYILAAAYGSYYNNEAIDFISIRSSFVTESLLSAAHEHGKMVHAWTVDTRSELERLRHLGVDNIITDYPVLAREILYQEEVTKNLLGYLRMVLR